MKMRLGLIFMTAVVAMPETQAMPLGQIPTITVDWRHDIVQATDVLGWVAAPDMEAPVVKHPRRDHMEPGQQSLSWDSTSIFEPLSIVILPRPSTLTTIVRTRLTSVDSHISTADYHEETSSTWTSLEPADTPSSTNASHEVSYLISRELIPTSELAATRTLTHDTTVTVTVTPTSTITVAPTTEPVVESSLEPQSSSTELSESPTTGTLTSDTTPDFPSSWVYSTRTTTTTLIDSTTDEPPMPTDPEVAGDDTENDARPFNLKHPMMFTFALGAAFAVALV
ncbi:hypothetical protein F5X68DRAFT_236120 [Plectosphaerella plurivora]|uniref:Uncharacterized protein n=1 Tax=Plectosphaerella plurivora TaxID=936078 RepID=A0A9P8V4H7_9PEZI|nr:hypothetical protein F5X68DRAFT_236120 [Plectosphaerella plurivora]